MIDRRNFIRPSNVPSMELCPGKVLLEARAVDRCPELLGVIHPVAQQGKVGHDLTAQTISMIYHGPDGWQDPKECLARMDSAISKLDAWSADASRVCVNYAVSLIDKQIKLGYQVQILVEMRLPGAFLGIARGGTADLILLCRNETSSEIQKVIVADWKMGFLYQGEAGNHLQLWTYAVMAYFKYEPENGVEIHLVQGRRKEFSAVEFDREQINNATTRVKNIVMKAQAAFPEVVTGIEQCRYCKALCLCAVSQGEIMKASEELALFGVSDENRVRLAEMARIATRFAEEVKLLQKEWVKTAQNVEIEF